MPDIHDNFGAPTEEEIAAMAPRIKAFIFPSIPRAAFEIEAFNRAVNYQIAHEKTIAKALENQSLPEGVESFTIGNFSMSFGDDAFSGRLTKKTICPTAYGILLEAGLMYKGVEGRLPVAYEPD